MKKKLKFLLFAITILSTSNSNAFSEKIIVSNERSNSLSILSKEGELIQELGTCGRPRGMHFSKDKKYFFVGCADDDLILYYDTNSLEVVGRIRNVLSPETFDLHPNGKHLVVSNEDDATATVWDWAEGKLLQEFNTGEEPEGVQITKDGKFAFVASEVADVVHVLNLLSGKIQKNIPVDRRPRRFALSNDGKKLFVSAELGSIVNIISTETFKVIKTIIFLPKGFKKEEITPVDVLLGQYSVINSSDFNRSKVLTFELITCRCSNVTKSVGIVKNGSLAVNADVTFLLNSGVITSLDILNSAKSINLSISFENSVPSSSIKSLMFCTNSA